MHANDAQRFIVKMEIYAAAGPVELDHETSSDSDRALADVLNDLAAADPDEVEDQTYRAFRFDVCNACRKELLARPLG